MGEDRERLKSLLKESRPGGPGGGDDRGRGCRPGRADQRTARGIGPSYYSRGLVTRIGKLELRVPRDREGRFSTELFDRFQRSEKALVSALDRDVRARRVDAQGQDGDLRSCAGTRSPRVRSVGSTRAWTACCAVFAQRRLDETYPYVILDAKLREGPPRRGHPVAGGLHRDRDQR